MKNKKGFTLIELLAVILVLGIIALIAIPVVNKVINQAKKGSFEATVNNVVKAIEDECQKNMLLGENPAKTYIFEDGLPTQTINVKGTLPKSGTISVNNSCETMVNVTDGKYRAKKIPTSDNLVITEVGPKVCHVTTGDGTEIGDEITCGTESFYIIDVIGDAIKMLAKYNLKVGKIYTSSSESVEISLNEEGYGLQNAEMIGYPSTGGYPRKGTTAFSSATQRGINYSDYEGSIVEEYVNDYADKLIDMELTVEEARLITKEELEGLGCDSTNGNCNASLEFVRGSSFWSYSAFENTRIWAVYSNGDFTNRSYSHENYFGIRPVIVISKFDI